MPHRTNSQLSLHVLDRMPRWVAANTIALTSKVSLVDGSNKCWVDMCAVEAYEGHADGAFEFTRETFDAIIRNFRRQVNPVPVYYGHPNRYDGQEPPAAGWVLDMKVEGDRLFGLCEWTERAALSIRAGEYKFCSVVVGFKSKDRKTNKDVGPEMYELGLTNIPFVDGQAPLMLSRRELATGGKSNMDPQKMIANVAKALGVDPNTPKEKLQELIGSICDFIAALEGKTATEVADEAGADVAKASRIVDLAKRFSTFRKLANEVIEPDGDETTQTADNTEDIAAGTQLLTKLVEATGLDAAGVLAAVTANIDAIVQLLSATPASGTPAESEAMKAARATALSARLSASQVALAKANTELAEFRKQAEEAKLSAQSARIDAAIQQGHILEDSKPFFLKLAAKMPEEFEAQLATVAKAPAVPTGVAFARKPSGEGDAVPVSIDPQGEDEEKFVGGLRQMQHPESDIPVMLSSFRTRVAAKATKNKNK